MMITISFTFPFCLFLSTYHSAILVKVQTLKQVDQVLKDLSLAEIFSATSSDIVFSVQELGKRYMESKVWCLKFSSSLADSLFLKISWLDFFLYVFMCAWGVGSS